MAGRFDISPLRRAIDRAVPDDPIGQLEPAIARLGPRGVEQLWAAVEEIKQHHPSVYGSYLGGDVTLATAIADEMAKSKRLGSLTTLLRRLKEREEAQGPRLVATSLANVRFPWSTLRLSDDVLAVSTPHDESDDGGRQSMVDAVREAFGVTLGTRERWLDMQDDPAVDSRTFAALVSREPGGRRPARSKARTRASYLLAVWTLLEPPASQMIVWPSVGAWAPQPYIELDLPTRRIVKYPPSKIEANQYVLGPYELPKRESIARAPIEAMTAALAGSRWAAAVLSAAWSWFAAVRIPNSLERADRLVHAFSAIDALVERRQPTTFAESRKRRGRLLDRLRLRDELVARGYDAKGVDQTLARLVTTRNIAAHGADSFLLNFGYPPGRARSHPGGRIARRDLALSVFAAELPMLLLVVELATRRLFLRGRATSWNDRSFGQFLRER